VVRREDFGEPERCSDPSGRSVALSCDRSRQAALDFLREGLADEKGVVLLHGPEEAGKSVVIEQFADELPATTAVAIVDGVRSRPNRFLSGILEQFGYGIELDSVDELLNMLCVIGVQLTRLHEAPVLIVRNVNGMYPATLNVLCKLATLSFNGRFAMRIILVGERYYYRIMNSPSMRPVADRVVSSYEMRPLTLRETIAYVNARLDSCGVDQPDLFFSIETCTKLHAASGGWPVTLDDLVARILDRSEGEPACLDDIESAGVPAAGQNSEVTVVPSSFPDETQLPRLIVTRDGETQQDIELSDSRILIGRAPVSDVVIDSHVVSRQHALLVECQGAWVIVDLKSRNGTFVNSRQVAQKILLDSDIVSIGNHRIKFILPIAREIPDLADFDVADTATMRTLGKANYDDESDANPCTVVDGRKA
jgi:type II secretory pathway predicted ATPase ExeA